jgi:hypothetical protein
MWKPNETQLAIAAIQHDRQGIVEDLHRARNHVRYLRQPGVRHRYRGQAGRLALDQQRASDWVAKLEHKLADADALLTQHVASLDA